MRKRLSPLAENYTALWMYATVLVAYFFRVYRLADKNIWWDEGWSLWMARHDPLWTALRTAADEHPPLHYWMLRLWGTLTDSLAPGSAASVFAGRWLSVAFGVLTVAVLYRVGKQVGGKWIGLLAALLLALARFHIWWSQDIKNYTPSIFFAFCAVWFGLALLDKPRARSVVGYAVFAALALWTHYLAGLILLALNVYAAVVFIARWRADRVKPAPRDDQPFGTLAHWALGQLLAAALFVPWLYVYLQNAAAWSAAPPFDFGLFLKLVATVLPLGVTTNIEQYAWLTLALTALAALGGVSAARGHRGPGLFVIIVLLPPLLIYLLSLTPVSFFAPKIQARYLLILLPAYVLLLALGIAALYKLGRPLALAALLVVLAADAWVLQGYYGERRLGDDYTTLANTINSFARPGDLVLLDTDQEWPTFLNYLRSPLDWLGAPNGATMNAPNADALVRQALARHDAVWVVAIPDALATDPQHLLETRLGRALPKQYEQTFGDKRLALYASARREMVDVPPANFAPQYVRSTSLGDSLRLLGFDVPVHEARAGDTVRVVTYWSASKPADVAIQWTGDLRSESLGLTRVASGARVRAETDLVVPPQATGDMGISIADRSLARVYVEPRAAAATAGAISHPVDYALDQGIHLVGYDLPVTNFHAGESVPITLYWRADGVIGRNYTVFVHLLGTQFNPAHIPPNPLWGQVDSIPVGGDYPTTAWRPNETVADAYRVPIETSAPAGEYQIEVGMYDPATGQRLALSGGDDSIILAKVGIVR